MLLMSDFMVGSRMVKSVMSRTRRRESQATMADRSTVLPVLYMQEMRIGNCEIAMLVGLRNVHGNEMRSICMHASRLATASEHSGWELAMRMSLER